MKRLLTSFLILILASSLQAQESVKKSLWDEMHFWADAGFGFALPDLAIGGGGSATVSYDKYFLSLRGLSVDGTPGFFNPTIIFTFDNPYHGYSINSDAALCIGLIERGSNGMLAIGVGVSYLNGFKLIQPIDSLDNGHRNFHAIGIAIDAQLSYSLFSWLGVTLHPFIDANPKQSFGGFMFGIQMGKLFYTP